MQMLKSYLNGAWVQGSGKAQTLVDPATEEPLAETCADGLDFEEGLAFARNEGGRALRSLTVGQRGELLANMARAIHEHRDELLDLGMQNGGGTRSDAKFDVDGASGTLTHYAELGSALGDAKYLVDGENIQLGPSPRLAGRHIYVPRRGVAVLINAFNFPGWGFAEKAACALLAGMPVICKPATSTALVAHRMMELLVDVAPKGSVSMVCGSAHALPGMLGYGDVIAFTGSSATARTLSSLPGVLASDVRLNVEADSLNAAVLGPDVDSDSETYDLFIRDVVKEMTQKTGQKCTAIRRVFVSEAISERVREDLIDRLSQIPVGNPSAAGVRMGPVATQQQHRDVKDGIAQLAEQATMVLGADGVEPIGVDAGKGYFVPATLLESADPGIARAHELEVFGPVATLLHAPDDPEQVCELLGRGRGGLVCSVYSDDRKYVAEMLAGAAPHHGRLVLGSRKIAGQALYPGMVLPQLLHGGPGRAGGGEELGGLRGVALYSQHTAVQGARPILDALLGKQ
jgi:3,4-dehydroadipyl-CoA semialdehyde dehydrogenase